TRGIVKGVEPLGTKQRMVAGAVELVRRRGVKATSMRDVVAHTGTPRGSLAHHFPRGKQELLEEAVRLAGRQAEMALKRLMDERGVAKGLRAFLALWRRTLEESDFDAGCPLLSVSVEAQADDDAGGAALLAMAADVFASLGGIVARALEREGVPTAR